MAHKSGMWYGATRRDSFQYQAFRVHYKIFKADYEPPEAFALAIAATRDDVMDRILKKNPDIVDNWKCSL